jgi:spore germination cell wall hydrolase CwlJ-like protein
VKTAYGLALMAVCIWREARNQSRDGKIAVAWVIRNRAEHPTWWGGPDIASVVTKPKQFSCFNADDPQVALWPSINDGGFRECMEIADAVLAGGTQDPTSGADHYYAKWMDAKGVTPAWAASYTHVKDIGDHRFFRSA